MQEKETKKEKVRKRERERERYSGRSWFESNSSPCDDSKLSKTAKNSMEQLRVTIF